MEYIMLIAFTMAICAKGLIWLQEVAETLEKLEVKRSEHPPLITGSGGLTHILHVVAPIAFLWDALMRLFWPDPFSIFS